MVLRALQRQHGYGLVETMVALFIMAIGLLGILGMQTRGIQFSQAAYHQSQAMFLAEDIVERIRANRDAALSYVTDIGGSQSGSSCELVQEDCTEGEIAASDLAVWKGALADALPSGDGSVAVARASGLFTVTVVIGYKVGTESVTYQQVTRL